MCHGYIHCISKPVKGGHSTSVSFQGGVRAPGAPPLPPPMHGEAKARALLDTGSLASFVSERLAQILKLRRFTQNARICGIAGLSHGSGKQSVTHFLVSSIHSPVRKLNVSAFIVPQVTCDLPAHPVTTKKSWKHLESLKLADPEYNKPVEMTYSDVFGSWKR